MTRGKSSQVEEKRNRQLQLACYYVSLSGETPRKFFNRVLNSQEIWGVKTENRTLQEVNLSLCSLHLPADEVSDLRSLYGP